jgi:hypothetical protein
MRKRHALKGIALVTTLAAFVVITMLVVAFLAAQRSQQRMSGLSVEKRACQEAARSVADFCRFHLEETESWARLAAGQVLDPVEYTDLAGNTVFSMQPVTAVAASAKPEFAGLTGEAFFEGRMVAEGVDVQVAITNNLANNAAHSSENVGPKACLLKIRAGRGATSETVEVLLRKASFFDSTIASTGQIRIEADQIDFASNDRLRNQIRSKADIALPKYQDIVFTPHPDSQTSERGTVWAAGNISVDGDSSEGTLKAAADATGGEFLPLAPTHYEIPRLKRTDLDSRSPKPKVILEPGEYLFSKATIEFKDFDGGVHEQEITVLGVYVDQSLVEFHFLETDLAIEEDPLVTPTPSVTPTPPVATPTPAVTATPLPGPVPDPSTVVLGDLSGIPEPTPEFYLGGFKMVIGGQGTGDFILGAESEYVVEGSLALGGGTARYPANLIFEDNDPDPDNPQEGSLSVGGDLTVGASIANCGKLLAENDVILSPRDVRLDKLEEETDIAIFAGRDVTIAPMFEGDEALRNATNRVFVFRGVLYAERDFKFVSSFVRGDDALEEYNRQLLVEGSVVARSGSVLIRGNEKVQVKYNREFLDDLLEKSKEDNKVQLEELSWRPL